MTRTVNITIQPKSGSFLGFRVAILDPDTVLAQKGGQGGNATASIPVEPVALRVDCDGLGAGSYQMVFQLPDEEHTYTVDRKMKNGSDAFKITV